MSAISNDSLPTWKVFLGLAGVGVIALKELTYDQATLWQQYNAHDPNNALYAPNACRACDAINDGHVSNPTVRKDLIKLEQERGQFPLNENG